MTASTVNTIEIRAFMGLSELFHKRGWPTPLIWQLEAPIEVSALLDALGVAQDTVESVIINRRARPVDGTLVQPGDRIALVPPGVPGPHRYTLGLHVPAKR